MVRYHPERRVITAFTLVSDEAEYVWYWQGTPQPGKMTITLEREP